MTHAKRCDGFTLVELVVVIVLLGAGVSFGVAMLGQVGEHVAWTERRSGVTREIRIAFERFARDIRGARAAQGIRLIESERLIVSTGEGAIVHEWRDGTWSRNGVVWLDAIESVRLEGFGVDKRPTADPHRVARVRLMLARSIGDGAVTRSITVGARQAAGLQGWIEEEAS